MNFQILFSSNSFIPLILQPARINSHSNSLIGNTFSNVVDSDIISATISDHLPRYLIIPNMPGNISGNTSNIYEGDRSKFDRENFILFYFPLDRQVLLKIDELNAKNSTKMYLDKIPIGLLKE